LKFGPARFHRFSLNFRKFSRFFNPGVEFSA
jgi:hypothetical protein